MATQKGRNWSSGDIVTAANLSSVERGVSAVSSAYEPTTWANGDTVTAAALNNIEQGIVNADGGGPSWVTLCEEEVTTEENHGMYMAFLSYSQLISADTIRVTFDGNEYMCESISPVAGTYTYGGFTQTGPDFSEYPFAVISGTFSDAGVVNQIMTETAGTHTIKIEALQESSGSSDFSVTTLTITNATSSAYTWSAPVIYSDGIGTTFYIEEQAQSAQQPSETNINIVLYQEWCTLYAPIDNGIIRNTFGNITYDGDDYYFITGDCSINIINDSSPK